jgi:CTP synthase N-terminus
MAMEVGAEKAKEMKYVLVTGGVVSGLGKGVTASSIGVVLKACGLRVTSIKIGKLNRLTSSLTNTIANA